MSKNYSEMSRTAYISGNIFIDRISWGGQTPPTIGRASIGRLVPACSPSYDIIDAGNFNLFMTIHQNWKDLNEAVPPRLIIKRRIQ
jgi:hypothetical protein